ncbi:movement protein, partial [Clarias magur]
QKAAVLQGATLPVLPSLLPHNANVNQTTPPLFKKDLITSLIDFTARISDHSTSHIT